MGDLPALQQRPDVLARSPYHHGKPAPGPDVPDGGPGQVQEERQAEVLVGLQDVQEVMGHTGAVLGGGLGCADVHLPVYLAAVGTDDLPIEGPGKVHGQGALAYGGGSNYEKNGGQKGDKGGRMGAWRLGRHWRRVSGA